MSGREHEHEHEHEHEYRYEHCCVSVGKGAARNLIEAWIWGFGRSVLYYLRVIDILVQPRLLIWLLL